MGDFESELSGDAKEKLQKLSDWGVDKYVAYRRKGISPNKALLFALAWARNSSEQADRRCAHETGVDRREYWRHVH